MTITSRRRAYWLFFILSLVVLLTSLVLALPVLFGHPTGRLRDYLEAAPRLALFGSGLGSVPASIVGGLGLSLFSSAVLLAVLVSFRKTGSQEIFFFAFWVLALSFEAGRILVLRLSTGPWPDSWASIATRFVLATRFAGYGAFFLAGLYASGFRGEHPGRSLLVVLALGLALVSALPLDSGLHDDTLLVRSGYGRSETIAAAVLGLLTAASMLVGASVTAEPGFRAVAAGSLALLAGQQLALRAWHPLLLLLAFLLLAVGARLFISRLHAYYLWQ